MSKMEGLQQALKNNSGKADVQKKQPVPVPHDTNGPTSPTTRSRGREGKESLSAWLNPDFGASLRMVQLCRRKDAQGRKVYLDDLIAEALNDLFLKYDVPTVHHE